MNGIPLHSLFNIQMKLLCLTGRDSEITHLQEEYNKLLNEREDLVMFSILAKATQLLIHHSYDEAIPLFEQIYNFSM